MARTVGLIKPKKGVKKPSESKPQGTETQNTQPQGAESQE